MTNEQIETKMENNTAKTVLGVIGAGAGVFGLRHLVVSDWYMNNPFGGMGAAGAIGVLAILSAYWASLNVKAYNKSAKDLKRMQNQMQMMQK